MSEDEPVTPPTPPTTPPLTVSPSAVTSAVTPAASERAGFPIDPSLPLVTDAVADLAGRLGIAPGDVTLVAARAVTWGDSSLGCPQPGMNYLQRLVDGALVILEVGGRRYEYHGGDPLFLCEHPKAPSGAVV